jgi:thioredoxin-like negative regulator of GroEL
VSLTGLSLAPTPPRRERDSTVVARRARRAGIGYRSPVSRRLAPALALALVPLVSLVSCTSPPPPSATAAAPPALSGSAQREPAAPLRFIDDDVPAALARARAEKKVVFVDAWAPWCHTCLSMKHFVLDDPSLRPLADQVIFAAIDTDRPENAAFLERHPIKALPTFFVLDPDDEHALGYWVGSSSVAEMRALLEESVREKAGGAPDAGSRAFAEARAAHAAGKLDAAEAAYRKAVEIAPASWPNRSAAVVGLLEVLRGKKDFQGCADLGARHLREVRGAVSPIDASAYLLDCAKQLPDPAARKEKEALALERLRELCAHPPEGSTVDDRADALDILSDALGEAGDAAAAREAQEKRLALMEAAARAAKTPEEAQTFDYGRANAYVALGRAPEAVRMLEQREKELPGSYEPPARLASVLNRSDRPAEALVAVERALARAYGPRRLRYLSLRASILRKLGDGARELATLREEVKGYEALPPGQASPESLADARRRLAEAEKRVAPPPATAASH